MAKFGLVLAFSISVVGNIPDVYASSEVNLYSAREEALIKPLLDRFSKDTGIKVNLVTGEADALLSRLVKEGRNSPADLFVTVDAGRLQRAKLAGVLRAVYDPDLRSAVPEAYRDPEGYWFGLSLRARVILYNKARVAPEKLSTYEDLAAPKWKGRICVRSSNNIYNQSLVASMVAANGEQATEAWAKQLVVNMARPPRGGDRDQIKAVAAGQCDLAIANTYYYGAMLDADKDPVQQQAARKLALFWPNQNGRGAHVNVSGAGVTRHAGNRGNAIRLLQYLISPEIQRWYAEVNYEYPVRPGVAVSGILQKWGKFDPDSLNLTALGKFNKTAVELMDRAGWK